MRRDLIEAGPYVVLFGLLYSAFGAASPFLPALLSSRGIAYEQIGLVLGVATGVRLISAPIAGRIADRSRSLRLTLAMCTTAAAAVAVGYLGVSDLLGIVVVSLLHALALAPTTNLTDALAITASKRRAFEYGWVRGAGSAAFIAASVVGGFAVSRFGLDVTVILQAGLLLAATVAIRLAEPINYTNVEQKASRSSLLDLAQNPVFMRIVAVSALVLGSHALHDTFSVIRWINAGISPQTVSLLWSLAVGAEVVVFFLVGPWLLERVGPGYAIGIAAGVGALRWLVSALTLEVGAIAFIQPFHGITFALLHLACMRLLALHVPLQLAATAQAIYGTVGVGVATALMTGASGWMYATFGGQAFLIMSVLCCLALPIALSLARLTPTARTPSKS